MEKVLLRALLAIAFAYSIAAAFLGPPFQLQADEGRRWIRAYALSQGVVFTEPEGKSTVLAHLDKRAARFEVTIMETLSPEKELTWDYVAERSERFSAAPPEITIRNVAAEAVVNAGLYLPAALGIWLGRQLGLDILHQLWLARLVNCLTAFALLLTAARLAGAQRLAVTAALLLPAATGLYPALDHTALATIVPVIFVLCIWRVCLGREPLDSVGHLRLAGLFLLLCLAKPPYSAFALTALAIPSARFGGLGRKVFALFLCGLPALFYQVWWGATTKLDMLSYFGLGEADPAMQWVRLKADPPAFFAQVWHTVTTIPHGNWTGALFPYTPPPYALLGIAGLALLPLLLLLPASALSAAPPRGERVPAMAPLIVLSFIATGLLFYLGFYLNFTEPEWPRIEGVALRYFLPCLALFAFALGQAWPESWRAPRTAALLFILLALSSWIVLGLGLEAQTAWLRS